MHRAHVLKMPVRMFFFLSVWLCVLEVRCAGHASGLWCYVCVSTFVYFLCVRFCKSPGELLYMLLVCCTLPPEVVN